MLLLSCCRHSTASSARDGMCNGSWLDVSDAESIVQKNLVHECFCQQTFATGTDATGLSRLVRGSAKCSAADEIAQEITKQMLCCRGDGRTPKERSEEGRLRRSRRLALLPRAMPFLQRNHNLKSLQAAPNMKKESG